MIETQLPERSMGAAAFAAGVVMGANTASVGAYTAAGRICVTATLTAPGIAELRINAMAIC